jgi:hypothetical protein
MMQRVELTNFIKGMQPDSDSNIKFYTLFRSRLMEEGIPIDHATQIAGFVKYDMSNIPEDDDTLSDVATEYAGYCIKVYNKMKLHGLNSIKDHTPFAKFYDRLFLKVDR